MDVRAATAADAPAISEIYNQGIDDRVATFRTEHPPVEQVRAWIGAGEREPFLVAEQNGRVDGWVKLSAYSDMYAYKGVGEYALYVRREARRQGVGRTLLSGLRDVARQAGYWKIVGKLFTANEASIELARAMGFRDVGVHLRHGSLDGEWRDVLVNEWLLEEG